MNDHRPLLARSPLLVVLLIVVVGFTAYFGWRQWNAAPVSDHHHDAGAHGGTIVAVGDEHYHVEALFAEGGVFKLFTLGKDQSQVISVPTQKLTAYLRTRQRSESVAVPLEPKPQPGDPDGETSMFEGKLPLDLVGSELLVVVPNVSIGKGRYRVSFRTEDHHEPLMPTKVTDAAEQDLYLKPGGKYTAADIKANGSTTASEKFRGFQSAHDMHPAQGAAICPITSTKANPKCTWIIGGKSYSFCCPPCIDEFVKLAKEQPAQIKDPAAYIKQ